MLRQGSTTDSIPVFVSDGRRRHHAVRLVAATIGLLLAGWLAALAAGLAGFAPLPGLTIPGGEETHPAAAAGSSGRDAAERARAPVEAAALGLAAREGAKTPPRQDSGGGSGRSASSAATTSPAATSTQPAGSGASGPGASSPGASSPGAAAGGTQTGDGATPGTGTGSTPSAGGSGTSSVSGSGREPAWTPPAAGTKSATPPRGRSETAPGTAVAGTASSQARRPSG